MTRLEKLKETFTEKEYNILIAIIDNSQLLEDPMIVPSNWRGWFGTDKLYNCKLKQAEIAEIAGVTSTAVSRAMSLFETYQLVKKIRGIKGYIVNKTWLYEPHTYKI